MLQPRMLALLLFLLPPAQAGFFTACMPGRFGPECNGDCDCTPGPHRHPPSLPPLAAAAAAAAAAATAAAAAATAAAAAAAG